MPPTLTMTRTREAAAFLKLAESTLRKVGVYGGGPAYSKAGARTVVYSLADLEAWVASTRRLSTSGDCSPR